MEKMINSQSAAAVNSANVVFTSNCSKSGYLQMPISNVNYDDVVAFVGRTIAEQKKDAYFEVIISNGISVDISFTKNYFSKKYEISYRVFVNGEIDYDACGSIELDFKVMSGVNVNKAVGAVARLIMEFIEDNKENKAPALEEATVLEETPSLDQAPSLEEDAVVEQIRKQYSYTDASGMDVLDLVSYFNDLEEEGADSAEEEAPSLEEAPVLDEVKILEDFCTNEASKIKAAGLTSVALSEEEHYLYDYEALYDYLVDAGFNEDRAYEIRDQYEDEVDRAIRGLLTDSTFVPVEVSYSDIESTEIFWDNITMPYSARGLVYVKENNSDVSMADIIREVAEEHWNFESVVKESHWTHFTNDSFRDLIWSTCWAEYLMEHTDGALEAETRYVMDFDSVYDDLFGELWPYMSTYDDSCGGCELWVNAWDVVERAAEIIEESVADSGTRWIDWDRFPDYIMTAFLGDLYGFETFTERVMSELEGGDIVDILPYDDGLHLSFVNDEAEVAA